MKDKSFELIKDKIVKTLETEQGIFTAVPHDDQDFQIFMAKELLPQLKGKIDFFFCEVSDIILQKLISRLKDQILEGDEKHNTKLSDQEKMQLVIDLYKTVPLLIPTVCASIIHDISAVGIDIPSEESKKKFNTVWNNPSSTEKDKNSALEDRIGDNKVMIKNIQNNTKNGEKYILLGGAIHAAVGTTLGIKKIFVYEDGFYSIFTQSLKENDRIKKKLTSAEAQPDFAYSYTKQNEKIIVRALDLPLHGDVSNSLSKEKNVVFSGVFSGEKAVTHSSENSDIELIKQKLKKKYTLKDTSKLELESGLRTAANTNISKSGYKCFEDITKFINCGVDINSQTLTNGKTALHYAVEKKHVESIEVLLSLGARVDIQDSAKQTVFALVEKDSELKTDLKFDKIRKICAEKFPSECEKLGCIFM